MKYILILTAVFWGGSALADPGHLTSVAGHDHWIALGAIGAAIATGIWGAIKGWSDEDENEAETDEAQET